MKPSFGDKKKYVTKTQTHFCIESRLETYTQKWPPSSTPSTCHIIPKGHFLTDKLNKKVPLTMTVEMQGKVLSETVCLRSKIS